MSGKAILGFFVVVGLAVLVSIGAGLGIGAFVLLIGLLCWAAAAKD